MASRWYTIQLLPQWETVAKGQLERQNFEVFFPQIEIQKTLKRVEIKPLFKGYAFVRFDPEKDRWLSINGTYGVVSLLPSWNKKNPMPVKEGMVEEYQSKNPIKESELIELVNRFVPGLEVKVKQGFFVHRDGKIVSIRNKYLEILLYGEAMPVMIHGHDVEPVEGR